MHERKDALSRLRPPHAGAICSGKACGDGPGPGCPRLQRWGWEGAAESSAGGLGAAPWSSSLSQEPQVSATPAGAPGAAGGPARRSPGARGARLPPPRSPTPPGTSQGAGGCWSIPGSVRQARQGLTPGSLLMFGGPAAPAIPTVPAVATIPALFCLPSELAKSPIWAQRSTRVAWDGAIPVPTGLPARSPMGWQQPWHSAQPRSHPTAPLSPGLGLHTEHSHQDSGTEVPHAPRHEVPHAPVTAGASIPAPHRGPIPPRRQPGSQCSQWGCAGAPSAGWDSGQDPPPGLLG